MKIEIKIEYVIITTYLINLYIYVIDEKVIIIKKSNKIN